MFGRGGCFIDDSMAIVSVVGNCGSIMKFHQGWMGLINEDAVSIFRHGIFILDGYARYHLSMAAADTMCDALDRR